MAVQPKLTLEDKQTKYNGKYERAEKRLRELPPRNYLNQMVFPVKTFKFLGNR